MGRWSQSRNRGGGATPAAPVIIPAPTVPDQFNALQVDVLFAELDFGADPLLPGVTQFIVMHTVNDNPETQDGNYAFSSVSNLGQFVIGDTVLIYAAWADVTGARISPWSEQISIAY